MTKSTHEGFGARLKKLALDQHGSMAAACRFGQFQEGNFKNWCRGTCEPKLTDVEKLGALFGVSLDYLISGQEAMANVQLRAVRMVMQEAINESLRMMPRIETEPEVEVVDTPGPVGHILGL